jgi:3-deoxy-7-phosphoheptulonate synthase
VDGPQALLLSELGWFLEDVAVARAAYEKRRSLALSHAASTPLPATA